MGGTERYGVGRMARRMLKWVRLLFEGSLVDGGGKEECLADSACGQE
jgi:hypothetical protein